MAMMSLGDSQQHAYEIAAEVGKGAYGTVYKARDMRNQGQFVALKEIRITTNTEEGMPMSTIREIALLRQLEKFDHPHIVRLLDVWTGQLNIHEMKLMLVFEYIDQDLSQYLEKAPSCGIGPDNIKELMQQILNGVDFLHTNRIVHRDLKPQNILVSNKGNIKIADFGLARIYSFSMALTTVVVTLYYRAPEILLQESYCSAVDLWSCGAILAELYLKRPLFQGTSEIDQLCKIFHFRGLPLCSEWPPTCALHRSSFKDKPKQSVQQYIPNMEHAAIDLFNRLLIFDQRKRISAAEALRHHWFLEEDSDMSASSFSSSALSHNSSLSSLDNMEGINLSVANGTVPPKAPQNCVVAASVAREEVPNELLACESPLVDHETNLHTTHIKQHVDNDRTSGYRGVDGRIAPCGINILLPTTRQNLPHGSHNVASGEEIHQPPPTIVDHVQQLYKPTATVASHTQRSASNHVNQSASSVNFASQSASSVNFASQSASSVSYSNQSASSVTYAHQSASGANRATQSASSVSYSNQSESSVNYSNQSASSINHACQPSTASSNNTKYVCQPPTTSVNHVPAIKSHVHEQHRPPTTHSQAPPSSTINHGQEQHKPSSTITYHSQDSYKHSVATVLSTNTAVINVLSHAQTHINDPEVTNNAAISSCYVTATNNMSSHAALTNSDVNIPAKHHASYIYDAGEDPSRSIKGVKRSRPC